MVSSAPYIFALLSDCRWHWHWLNHIKSAPFAVSCGLICWLAHANELHSFRWFHMKLRDSPDCSTVAKSIPNYWNNTIILYRRQSSTAKSEIEREWKRLIAAIYRYIAFVLCSRVFISWLLSSWEKRQLLIANTHPSSHSKFSVFCKPNFRKLSTHFVYRGLLCCVSVLCIPHSIVWQKIAKFLSAPRALKRKTFVHYLFVFSWQIRASSKRSSSRSPWARYYLISLKLR